jgi:ribosomal protein L31
MEDKKPTSRGFVIDKSKFLKSAEERKAREAHIQASLDIHSKSAAMYSGIVKEIDQSKERVDELLAKQAEGLKMLNLSNTNELADAIDKFSKQYSKATIPSDVYSQLNLGQNLGVDYVSRYAQLEAQSRRISDHLFNDEQHRRELVSAPVEELGNKLDDRLSEIAQSSKEFTESLQRINESQLLLAEYIKQSGAESSELARAGINQNKWVLFIAAITLGVTAYSTFKTSAPITETAAQTIQVNSTQLSPSTKQLPKPNKTIAPSEPAIHTEAEQNDSVQIEGQK